MVDLERRRSGMVRRVRPGSLKVLVIQAADPLRQRAVEDQAEVAREALRQYVDVDVVVANTHDKLSEEIDRYAPAFVVPCAAPGGQDEVRLCDFLELVGIPFAGCSAATRRVCSDKVAAKTVAELAGLTCPSHYVIGSRSIVGWGIRAPLNRFASECGPEGVVIKPVHGADALGVKFARPGGDLASRVTSALNYDSEIMLEPFIAGREFSVIVTGPAENPGIFGVAEIFGPVTSPRSNPSLWERKVEPAHNVPSQVHDGARAAYQALGCRDAATVDFIVDGDGRSFFLEIDTALDCSFGGRVECAAAVKGRPALEAMSLFLERLISRDH